LKILNNRIYITEKKRYMDMSKSFYKTEQEKFWAGGFGDEYIVRNQSAEILASNLALFVRCLYRINKISSIIEFGSNIGMNLMALKLLLPNIELSAIEINKKAVDELSSVIPRENIFNESILDFQPKTTYDLVLIKGVLIHINPESLPFVYDKLFESSKRYVLLCEYYNPSPVSIPYRGHVDRLFKRDFAGELMSKYPILQLVDYGFVYHGDSLFPQDDITWFLLEK